jgi:hypothetical protein
MNQIFLVIEQSICLCQRMVYDINRLQSSSKSLYLEFLSFQQSAMRIIAWTMANIRTEISQMMLYSPDDRLQEMTRHSASFSKSAEGRCLSAPVHLIFHQVKFT